MKLHELQRLYQEGKLTAEQALEYAYDMNRVKLGDNPDIADMKKVVQRYLEIAGKALPEPKEDACPK